MPHRTPLLVAALLAAQTVCQPAASAARPMFEFTLGKAAGVSDATGAGLSQAAVAGVMEGVAAGRKESLYFLGLMRLYGNYGSAADPAAAADAFRKSATAGYGPAQSALAMLLRHGHGVAADDRSALAWAAAAAEQDEVPARWLLGLIHLEGRGVDAGPSAAAAVEHFRAAADLGSPEAHHYLGVISEYGAAGADQDQPAAAAWYRKARQLGHTESTYHLALMHASGRGGIEPSMERASLYLKEAAEAMHGGAMHQLGVMCMYGQGVPVDYDLALLWFERAASLDDGKWSAGARAAADELRASLDKAKEHNDKVATLFV